jgi:hypothetical protein
LECRKSIIMRWFVSFISASFMCAAVGAAEVDHRPTVAAAISSARDNLLTDIQGETILPGLSVGEYLARTKSQQRLVTVLEGAKEIGGERWLDEQTCQVRLDIPGRAVKLELWKIAVDHPADPVTPDEMAHYLSEWDFRVFSATGTSTARLDGIRPPPTSAAWKDATDGEIRSAVMAARADAVEHVLGSVAGVPLAGNSRIGDALAIEPVKHSMVDWLNNRPVTMVDFQDNKRVRLALAVSPLDLCNQFRAVLAERTDVTVPGDDQGWAVVLDNIVRSMSASVGDVKANIVPMTTQPVVLELPAQPPVWTSHRLVATASGNGKNALRAARAAEAAALRAIRQQVDKLSIGQGATLGDLESRDLALSSAIDRAVNRNSHLDSVEYLSDTQAQARLFLNLQDLWDAIDVQ